MKILIILILIIIGAYLANSYLYESFSNQMNQLNDIRYGNGEDYYPNQYVDRTCPCLSCIQQPCVSTNKA
jgi:hypothetical protein